MATPRKAGAVLIRRAIQRTELEIRRPMSIYAGQSGAHNKVPASEIAAGARRRLAQLRVLLGE